MEDEKLIFGFVLKKIRNNREISIRRLASILGISAVYLSDLENNARKVTLNVIEKIKSNLILTEDEEKLMMNAFTHDRLNVPVEILYYLIDNDLLDSIKTIKKEDAKGESIKRLAKTFKTENNNIYNTY